jgi:hypothetical protein
MRGNRIAWRLAAIVAVVLAIAGADAAVRRGAARVASAAASAPVSAPSATAVASGPLPAAAPATASTPVAADLVQWCRRLASQVPGLARPGCQQSGLVAGEGRSVRGVPLWTRDVAPPGRPARFRVLLLGGIHGDELTSVALAFDWIARSRAAQTLAGTAAGDIAWRIVPVLNPDGLLHTPATRVNAHGVDLNRNFPTADWARDARPYWIQRTHRDPRRFPGPSPLSEPESRWLLQQIEQFQPDLIVSVHAPYGLLDFDGPPPVPSRLGNLQLDPVGVYPGSLGNYGGLVRRLPVMTLELKNARAITPAELEAMWSDLLRWIGQRMARDGRQASLARAASAP